MTAGSGIVHQEMPKPVNGHMGGFQLWVNLPHAAKMMNPRYQEIKSHQIPVVNTGADVSVRVICGTFNGVTGPVRDIIADPRFLDVTLGTNTVFSCPVNVGHTAVAYIIGGEGTFDTSEGHPVRNRDVILFGDGSSIEGRSAETGLRFLLIAGRPIGEPVAWRGPIVMNTNEELRQAFQEYEDGTFIKARA
jgi:redox-sensitive bicupin YhaK (pirin superfamily)